MKILSMTATFGKLDGETLELNPALNIQSAPNEWGKSTWCAFLSAMLYGVDTRERTTREQLADKERYLPWTGKPMSGTMLVSTFLIAVERVTRLKDWKIMPILRRKRRISLPCRPITSVPSTIS